MAIIREKRNSNFTIMGNTGLRDPEMSAKAKGVLAYMLSLPDDWTFYETELTNHFTDGRNSIRTALKELENKGYLVRERIRNENGTLGASNWRLFDEPVKKEPMSENHTLVYHNLDNSTLLSTNNKLSTNNTNIVQNESATDSLQERFDELWKLYPIKKGKALAFKSYKRDIKKKDVTDSLIEKGILKYISNCKKENTDKRYMKHGGTFFSQQVYLDDYEADGSIQEVESINKPKPVVIPADWKC